MEAAQGGPTETLAAYMARFYRAKRGYRMGTVPEANALVPACDYILTRPDGTAFSILCIVDREADPDRTFTLSPSAVEEIGKACLRYTGRFGRTQMPMRIEIVEIGAVPISDAQKRRLAVYKRSSFFSKAVILAKAIDTASQSIWTNAPLGGPLRGPGLRKMAFGPRLSPAELRPADVVYNPGQGVQVVTYGLLTVLIMVFALEQTQGLGPVSSRLDPSIDTLVALGGLNRTLVAAGDWYRIVTAPFLHGGPLHLLLNGVVLFVEGTMLERLLGRSWFAAIYAVSAITGSLVSLALNPVNVVSVGASGAIMGLVAAAFVCSFHFPTGGIRSELQTRSLQVLIPALIPLASAMGQRVDFGAHLGGALGGALMGAVILGVWPRTDPAPRFRALAAAVSIAGLAAALVAGTFAREGYAKVSRDRALRAVLIPTERLPKTSAAGISQSADLVAQFPRDPRSHMYRFAALEAARDLNGAEREARAGLAEAETMKTLFPPALGDTLQAQLATVLYEKGSKAEARTVAQPVCRDSAAPIARAMVDRLKLCGPS